MFQPVHQRDNWRSLGTLGRFVLPAGLVAGVAGWLVIAPFPIGAGALFAALAGWLLILYPILLPIGMIASIPVQDAIPAPEGVAITATRLMTVAAAIALPLVLIRRSGRVENSRFLLLILAIIVMLTVSIWNAVNLAGVFGEIYHWFIAGFVFWLVIQFVRTPRQVTSLIAVFAVLAIAQGTLGIVQALFGFGPASFEIASGFSRAFGTFGMPNSFAAYVEVVTLPLIPVCVWAVWRARDNLRSYRIERLRGYQASIETRRALILSILLALLISAGTLTGLLAIAVSFSRGGWLGSIAAIGVMVILLGRRAVAVSTLLALLLSLGLMLGASGEALEVIEDRFTQLVQQVQIGDIRGIPVTEDNFATVERMSHWQTAIAMWDRHPWIGVGAGNFDDRFGEFAVHPRFDESQGHAHNYYLHRMAETGLVGLFVYFVFLAATFVIGWRAFRAPNPLTRAIGIGAIGLSTALAVHNIFENLHVLNISGQMMAVWALAVIATRWTTANRNGQDPPDENHNLLYDSTRRTRRRYVPNP